MSISNPSGSSGATSGLSLCAQPASARNAARSRSGSCSSKRTDPGGNKARAWATGMAGRTPAAAERAQHLATTWRWWSSRVRKSRSEPGSRRERSRLRKRSVENVGIHRLSARRPCVHRVLVFETVVSGDMFVPHGPSPCVVGLPSFAAQEFDRPRVCARIVRGRFDQPSSTGRGDLASLARGASHERRRASGRGGELQASRFRHRDPSAVGDDRRGPGTPRRNIGRPHPLVMARRIDEHRRPEDTKSSGSTYKSTRIQPAPTPNPEQGAAWTLCECPSSKPDENRERREWASLKPLVQTGPECEQLGCLSEGAGFAQITPEKYRFEPFSTHYDRVLKVFLPSSPLFGFYD